ncbi:hypothetical protein GSF22_33730, partial [Micromonospora echinofusca]|nr:hypothetical protein [Micromonospora echinofusca]
MPENLSWPDSGAGSGGAGRPASAGATVATVTPEPVPLLAAKLAVAPLPEPVLVRSRLLARLDAAATGPVTLVRAPAGWGKTTLLASWFRAGMAQRGAAWLSVGPTESAGRLWPYLHAALTATVSAT